MIRAKDNPFAVDRWQSVGFIPQSETIDQLADRFRQLDHIAAIVGPHGAGKTTLLEHLEAYLRDRGAPTAKLFLNLGTKLPWPQITTCIRTIPSNGVLFFDGASHLPRWRFWQLKRAVARQHIGLVITSHTEGRLPTLTHCRPNPNLLKTIVCHLLDGDQIFEESYLEEIFDQHNGNIRNCLWHLYDDYAANGT